MADENININDTDLSENNRKPGVLSFVFDFIDSLVFSLIIVCLLFTVVFSNAEVKGESMLDTLQNANHLIVYDFLYTPKHGDIIIISRNTANEKDCEEDAIVKRVIAIAGDTIEIKNGEVFVNGKKEHYAGGKYTANREFPDGVQTVPKGRVFVLGDNREVSADSRYSGLGYVDTRYIIGKVILRIYPFDKIKTFV